MLHHLKLSKKCIKELEASNRDDESNTVYDDESAMKIFEVQKKKYRKHRSEGVNLNKLPAIREE